MSTSTPVIGIPDREDYGPDFGSALADQEGLRFVVQKHDAERAGTHRDVRLGTQKSGLYSWAVRKGLPPPGGKHLAVQQPVHSWDYRDFEGEIPEGYGKGLVAKEKDSEALLTRIEPDALHFTLTSGRHPERYVLVRPNERVSKNWLLINTTPSSPETAAKRHLKAIPQDKIDSVLETLEPGSTVQAKIDGALAFIRLVNGSPEVTSHRVQTATGMPIVHTERVFGGRPQHPLPAELRNLLLAAEIHGVKNGKSIPVQELGALLNMAPARSLKTQKERGIQMRLALLDMLERKGRAVKSMSPDQRRAELSKVVQAVPGDVYTLPDEAKTPEEAQAMLEAIRAGKHPQTAEGVVVYPAGGSPMKAPVETEADVWITGVVKGTGKYAGQMGALLYALEPGGPTVGRVGTGFSDDTRRLMGEDSSSLKGRRMRIKAKQQFPSGAYRAPVFVALHEDYPSQKEAAVLLRKPGITAEQWQRYWELLNKWEEKSRQLQSQTGFLAGLKKAWHATIKKPLSPADKRNPLLRTATFTTAKETLK